MLLLGAGQPQSPGLGGQRRDAQTHRPYHWCALVRHPAPRDPPPPIPNSPLGWQHPQPEGDPLPADPIPVSQALTSNSPLGKTPKRQVAQDRGGDGQKALGKRTEGTLGSLTFTQTELSRWSPR